MCVISGILQTMFFQTQTRSASGDDSCQEEWKRHFHFIPPQFSRLSLVLSTIALPFELKYLETEKEKYATDVFCSEDSAAMGAWTASYRKKWPSIIMCRVEKQEARLYYMHCIAIIASSPCFFYPGCLQVARFSHRPWNTHRCTLFLLVPDGFRLWVVIRKAATSKFSVKQTRSVCFWISQDQIWYVDNRLIDGCKKWSCRGLAIPLRTVLQREINRQTRVCK